MFTISPIDARTADRLRAAATVVRVADESPGYPCRQCLRDAEVGEELVLVSYDPFEGFGEHSPYRSASPIFLHRDDCGGRLDTARSCRISSPADGCRSGRSTPRR